MEEKVTIPEVILSQRYPVFLAMRSDFAYKDPLTVPSCRATGSPADSVHVGGGHWIRPAFSHLPRSTNRVTPNGMQGVTSLLEFLLLTPAVNEGDLGAEAVGDRVLESLSMLHRAHAAGWNARSSSGVRWR